MVNRATSGDKAIRNQSHPSCSVIIVTFARTDMFKEALNSALVSGAGNIIIFDNNFEGSRELGTICDVLGTTTFRECRLGDGILTSTAKVFAGKTKVHYLCSGENIGGAGGFAKGFEYLIEHIRSDYCLFIDDDGELTPGCVPILVDEAEESGAPFVAPAIFNVPSNAYELGQHKVTIDPSTLAETHPTLHDLRVDRIPLEANGFVGVLCNVSKLQEVGGVDPRFFILFDDVDATFRLSKRFGPGTLLTRCLVRHKYRAGAATPYWKTVAEARSRILFVARNGSRRARILWFLRGIRACVLRSPHTAVTLRAIGVLTAAVIGRPNRFSPTQFVG